jgi:hypothetical protein
MRFRILFILIFFGIPYTYGQAISAFSDYRGYLMAFDHGDIRKLEYLPVKSYKTGSSGVAYIDNDNDFKVYYNGESKVQVNAADFSYWITDYLIGFKVGNVLYVNAGGERRLLSYYNTRMSLSDSLLCWFDDVKYSFSIFYDNKVLELESSLLEPPKSMKTGSNTLAWVNQSEFFQVFYQGNVRQLDDVVPVKYENGQDVMAWVDGFNQFFHIFYRGDTATVGPFAPDSFKVGYGTVAYVDQLGNFNVFYDGGVRQLLPDRPDYFLVKGNVVLYSYNNQFNVFYAGKTYAVETYIPTDFKLGINGVAYADPGGTLKYFFKGKPYNVTAEAVNGYSISGDVLKVEVGTNTSQFFWEGQLYEQE